MLPVRQIISFFVCAVGLSACVSSQSDFTWTDPIADVQQYELLPPGQNGHLTIPQMSGTSFIVPDYALLLKPLSISGVWTLQGENANCRIVTPQTPVNKGYHVRTLGCTPPYSQITYWTLINDKVLAFYDRRDNLVAHFYSVQRGRLDGIAVNGEIIRLMR